MIGITRLFLIGLGVSFLLGSPVAIGESVKKGTSPNQKHSPKNVTSKVDKKFDFVRLMGRKIKTSKSLRAAYLDKENTVAGERSVFASFLPTVDFTGDYGHEDIKKPSAVDTSSQIDELGLELTQTIFNGGQRSNNFRIAKIKTSSAQIGYGIETNNLILQGLNYYTTLISASQARALAFESERRLQKAYGTEEFRVKRGSGLKSDLLQVRRQLAGARRTALNANVAFQIARDGFVTFFETPKLELNALKLPTLKLTMLPGKLNEALEKSASNSNLQILANSLSISRLNLSNSRRKYWSPKLDFVASSKRKEHIAGTRGTKFEHLVKLNMTFPIYAGGLHAVEVENSKRSYASSRLRLDEYRKNLSHQVRNAWRQYVASSDNLKFAQNETNIAGSFYKIVRKERSVNKRKVFELISAELAFYSAQIAENNARSSLVGAQASLINKLGDLTLDAFN